MMNRKGEKSFLQKKMKSARAEFIVVFGRRRVGKTYLLEESLNSPLFFTADLSNPVNLMNKFLDRFKDLLDLPVSSSISCWDEFFQFLVKSINGKKNKQAVIFDDFQHILSRDASFLSILQKWWENELSKLPVTIVLCGANINLMEKKILSQKSPVFSSITGQCLIKPLVFSDCFFSLNTIKPDDMVAKFSLTGGIPLYLKELSGFSSFSAALKEKVLVPGSFLLEEGRFLAMDEFSKDPSTYFDILCSVAAGKVTPNEIAGSTRMEYNGLGTYLKKLVEMNLLKKELPFSLKKPKKTPHYFIDNDYLRFYFKYLYPHRDLVYRGRGDELLGIIENSLPEFLSLTFEKIAKQYVSRKEQPESIGSWWKKGESIDVVAIKENTLIVGDTSWADEPMDFKALGELRRKTGLLLTELGQPFKRVVYYLFSKPGFEDLEESSDLVLIDLERVTSSEI